MGAQESVRPLRLLVMKRGEHWIAQGVDLDVCAQARTQTGVFEAFSRQLFDSVAVAVRDGLDIQQEHPKAPGWCIDAYDAGFQIPPEMTPLTMAPRMDWASLVSSIDDAQRKQVEERVQAILSRVVTAVAA